MKKAVSDQIAKNPTQFNIAAIAKLEEEALDRRTRTERDSDAIVKFIGSVKFLVLHAILVAVWSTVNLNLIPFVKAFDPFPFGILALFVPAESVFLTIFVLISQNRMARQGGKALASRSSGRHACRTGAHHGCSRCCKNSASTPAST
jgi:uncharacterized membrane protein